MREHYIKNLRDSVVVYGVAFIGEQRGIRLTWNIGSGFHLGRRYPYSPTEDLWAILYIVKGKVIITWRTWDSKSEF